MGKYDQINAKIAEINKSAASLLGDKAVKLSPLTEEQPKKETPKREVTKKEPKKLSDDGVTTQPTGIQGTDISWKDLLSMSSPTVDEEGIRKEVTRQFEPARSRIEGAYGRRIAEAREQNAQQGRALEGQLGTRRRFSSSASAYLEFVDDNNKKEIASLEMQMEDALAQADMRVVQAIDLAIQRKTQENREKFTDIMKVLEFKNKMDEADEATMFAQRDGFIADLINSGIEDPAELQRQALENGFENTRLDDVIAVQDLLAEKGDDLTGLTADLKTFAFLYPELEAGTPEYRNAYRRFIAEQAAAKRAPKGEDDSPLSLLDIGRAEELYGIVVPPYMTRGELDQYIKDNPGATPEELQAGIDSIYGPQKGEAGIDGNSFFLGGATKDLLSKQKQTPEAIKQLAKEKGVSDEQLKSAQEKYTDEEVLQFLLEL